MMNKDMFLQAINSICDEIIENKEYLNELDTKIGDSDHGTNMARGFSEAKNKLEINKDKDMSTILKIIAMTLISTIGGASGPLYGTAFLKSSIAIKDRYILESSDFIKVYENIIDGIKQRGHAELGHKTMLDTIIPAYEAFKLSLTQIDDLKIASQKATRAAENGMNKTKDMKAIKGRASFLGERSIGHIDPGATSSYLIIKCVDQVIQKG